MRFSLEEFTEMITIPYLLEIEDQDEIDNLLRNRKSSSAADRQRMIDQTENDDAFEFPVLDSQTVF
jgi:hypothetical protein